MNNEPAILTGKHKNKAITSLGTVYRYSINKDSKYPEIGVIEVNNAVSHLSCAYADIDHLNIEIERLKGIIQYGVDLAEDITDSKQLAKQLVEEIDTDPNE